MIGYVLTDVAVLAVIVVTVVVVAVYIAFTLWVLRLLDDARRSMK